MKKRTFTNNPKPECKLAFKLSTDLLVQIEAAALALDMSKSQLCRRSVRDFIALYAPEIVDEGVSVIEPKDL
jgi:hypothetical protein